MRAIVASYVGVVLFAGLVFVGAGTLRYPPGLVYLGLAAFGVTVTHLLSPRGSDLTERRAREVGAGAAWDRRLLAIGGLSNAAMFVLAGLDSGRFRWSGDLPAAVPLVGAAAMVAGQLLFALARRENTFFTSTVRIDTARGHRVCDTGPYRILRHPGYLGLLLSTLAFPLVLQALTAFAPAAVSAAVLIVRTLREDDHLQRGLPGYAEYTSRVRWRLAPGVF